MSNTFDRNYSFFSLFKFAFPSIMMQLFLSLYTTIDGMFVSRYAGTTAFSGLNIAYPIINVGLAIAIMLSVGAGAYVSKEMGEQKFEQARLDFSFLLIIATLIGFLFMIVCLLFLEPILRLLGANDILLPYCMTYAKILLYFQPLVFVEVIMHTFFITAGHPTLGLVSTLLSGITNMVLDYIFVYRLNLGILGAASATGIGYSITAIIGLVFFTFKRDGLLYFVKPKANIPMLIRSCINGSSEMVTNIAFSITMSLFNLMFMKYYGQDGVASIAIILYLQYAFTAIFFGYTMGVSPVLAYKYGAKDHKQMHEIVNISLRFIVIFSIFSYGLSQISIHTILDIFAGQNSEVYRISLEGFNPFAISFLLSGFGICASSLFTSLSDGKTSAIISFGRTFLFLTGSILLLPILFEAKGLWYSVTVSEILGTLLSMYYFFKYKSKYGY